jgi:hypothetical protein
MPRTLLKRYFAHHLKLMVDYNLDPAAIDGLNGIGPVKAQRTTDYGFAKGADDKDLVYNGKRCVLLTGDFRSINERKYPPCQHDGIIILREQRALPEKIVACVKAFAQSGYRKETWHNVIHLWLTKAIIHKHGGKQEEVTL